MKTRSSAEFVVVAISITAGIGLWLAASPAAQEQVWSIASDGSDVRIDVGRSGVFRAAGHDHEVIAPAISGRVRLDLERLEDADISLTFDASALKVTGKGEPPEDVREVQQTMLGQKVLDVAKYPTITFRSREIAVQSRKGDQVLLRVAGDLTLHGVSRRIEAPIEVRMTSNRLTGTGKAVIKQTDFGIEPVSAGLGTVKVKNEVSVSFTFLARR
jgi:polyisoprenoid-binding protein YceI